MVVNDNDDDDDDDENNKTNDDDDDDNDDGATFVSKQELVTMERTHPALSVPPDAEDFFFRRQEVAPVEVGESREGGKQSREEANVR